MFLYVNHYEHRGLLPLSTLFNTSQAEYMTVGQAPVSGIKDGYDETQEMHQRTPLIQKISTFR